MVSAVDNENPSGEGIERTYTSFVIAGESFAVDVASIKEIVKSKEILPLKEPLKNVKGFIELHSISIPVLNTSGILNLKSHDQDSGVMVVNIDGYILGLMVEIDADLEVFSTLSKPAPLKGDEPLKDFIEGTVKVSNKKINVLALANLISTESRARLFARQ